MIAVKTTHKSHMNVIGMYCVIMLATKKITGLTNRVLDMLDEVTSHRASAVARAQMWIRDITVKLDSLRLPTEKQEVRGWDMSEIGKLMLMRWIMQLSETVNTNCISSVVWSGFGQCFLVFRSLFLLWFGWMVRLALMFQLRFSLTFFVVLTPVWAVVFWYFTITLLHFSPGFV